MEIDNPLINQTLTLKETTTPSNPSSGDNKLYFKSDGKLYKLNHSGVEVEVAGGSSTPNQLPKTGALVSRLVGDDGYYQVGLTGTRFTDNGDGTADDATSDLTVPIDPSKIIPDGYGTVGSNLGYWRNTLGSITLGQVVSINFLDWAIDTSVVIGAIKFQDSSAYRCIQANNCSAHEPGVNADASTYWSQIPEYIGNKHFNLNDYVSYMGSPIDLYKCILAYDDSSFEPTNAYNWATKWTVVPHWTTATAYTTSSYVWDSYTLYHCILAHTSGDLDDEPGIGAVWTVYWEVLSPDYWTGGFSYTTGDFVQYYDGEFYHCTASHLSSEIGPDNTTYWEIQTLPSDWAIDTNYTSGDIVNISYTFYRCILDNLSSAHQPTVNADWADFWETSSATRESPGIYACQTAHTAADDKFPVTGTYWIAYDSTWSTTPKASTSSGITRSEGLTWNGHSDWIMANEMQLASLRTGEPNSAGFFLDPIFTGSWTTDTDGIWSSTYRIIAGLGEYGNSFMNPSSGGFSSAISTSSKIILPVRSKTSITLPTNGLSLISIAATPTISGGTGSASYLNDGILSAVSSSANTWHDTSNQNAVYDFGSSKTVNHLKVNYMTGFAPYALPSSVLIEYWNGSSWVAVSSQATVSFPIIGGSSAVSWKKYTFTPVSTTKIRISITVTTGFAIGEIEAVGY